MNQDDKFFVALHLAFQYQAIAKLFPDDHGGVFTTQQFRKSMGEVLFDKRTIKKRKPPPLEICRRQLRINSLVIELGNDEWLTTDSRG